MKRIILLSLLIVFCWGNNRPIALAGNLVDRVNAYPEWRSKPTVQAATGDLPYPDWMAGNWTVKSVLVDREAPLAPAITTPGFESNRHDLQNPIEFPVRFIEKPLVRGKIFSFPFSIIKKTAIVADRSFNSLSLGRAYLGENVLLAVKVDPDNPNRQISFFRGDRQLLSTIVGRDSESPDRDRFLATEISQQIFRGEGDLYFNEVEVTTDYRRLPDGIILADQIVAIYLSPRDPDYFRARSRPVALYRYRLELSEEAGGNLNSGQKLFP